MATHKKVCNIKSCEKWAVIDGYCTAHAKELSAEKHAAKNAARRERESGPVTPTPQPLPAVSSTEELTINLLQALRTLMQSNLDREIADINKELTGITEQHMQLQYVFNRLYRHQWGWDYDR